MDTTDFAYDLPRALIAQHPLDERPASRMLVLDRAASGIAHRRFSDLATVLKPGDLLVLNDTRVIPARIRAAKETTGGGVELLFLEDRGDGTWEALLRTSRRPRLGSMLVIGRGDARAELIEDGERGRCLLRIQSERSLLDILEEEGAPPLPLHPTERGSRGLRPRSRTLSDGVCHRTRGSGGPHRRSPFHPGTFAEPRHPGRSPCTADPACGHRHLPPGHRRPRGRPPDGGRAV